MKAPEGRTLGSISMVDVAPNGTLWIAERCGANDCLPNGDVDPILHVASNGEWLGAFGAGLFAWPHGIYVDAAGNVWVTDARGGDDRGHQVIKFAADGRELLRLGTSAHAGDGPTHFNGPTDVVVAPNGDVFVSDGHEAMSNNRIVKFSANGQYIKEWGGTGSEPGKFIVPHALALDSQGRLFVADRDNNRIQIFDQDGTFLDQWRQFGRPSGITITRDDTIYVTDSESGPDTGARELPGIKKGIRIGSAKDGSVRAFIEDSESTVADHSGAEGVGVDAQGNVYGAVVRRQMLERHVLGK